MVNTDETIEAPAEAPADGSGESSVNLEPAPAAEPTQGESSAPTQNPPLAEGELRDGWMDGWEGNFVIDDYRSYKF